MWNKMPPKTKDLLAETFERIMTVAANADAVADAAAADKAADEAADDAARRAQDAPADVKDKYDSGQPDILDILEQRWKHTTPTPKTGGSRKRSINCRRPRGFSQRQHCKYGRKGWGRTTRRNRTR